MTTSIGCSSPRRRAARSMRSSDVEFQAVPALDLARRRAAAQHLAQAWQRVCSTSCCSRRLACRRHRRHDAAAGCGDLGVGGAREPPTKFVRAGRRRTPRGCADRRTPARTVRPVASISVAPRSSCTIRRASAVAPTNTMRPCCAATAPSSNTCDPALVRAGGGRWPGGRDDSARAGHEEVGGDRWASHDRVPAPPRVVARRRPRRVRRPRGACRATGRPTRGGRHDGAGPVSWRGTRPAPRWLRRRRARRASRTTNAPSRSPASAVRAGARDDAHADGAASGPVDTNGGRPGLSPDAITRQASWAGRMG